MESDNLEGLGDLSKYFSAVEGGRNPRSSGNSKGDSHVNRSTYECGKCYKKIMHMMLSQQKGSGSTA